MKKLELIDWIILGTIVVLSLVVFKAINSRMALEQECAPLCVDVCKPGEYKCEAIPGALAVEYICIKGRLGCYEWSGIKTCLFGCYGDHCSECNPRLCDTLDKQYCSGTMTLTIEDYYCVNSHCMKDEPKEEVCPLGCIADMCAVCKFGAVRDCIAPNGCPGEQGCSDIGQWEECITELYMWPDEVCRETPPPVPIEVIDTDKDGIPDIEDDCPFEPGLKILGGCPLKFLPAFSLLLIIVILLLMLKKLKRS